MLKIIKLTTIYKNFLLYQEKADIKMSALKFFNYNSGLGHVLNGKSSGIVYHLIIDKHFITFLCQLIGLEE
jgi:hypothetical protein